MHMTQDFTTWSIEQLESQIRRHNDLYFTHATPEISDAEYDAMVHALRELAPGSAVLQEVGAPVASGAQVVHRVPMLSLGKAYSAEEVAAWAEKLGASMVATPKVDGVAMSLHYDAEGRFVRAATRGDGQQGEDITANVRHIRDVPQKIALGNVEVRGEAYMPLSVFQESFAEEFASPRNLTAGALKQKDAEKTATFCLGFWPYDLLDAGAATETEKWNLLEQSNFPVIDRRVLEVTDITATCDYFTQQRSSYDFETDGAVFKLDSLAEQMKHGSTAHHPRFALAFKFPGDAGVTTVEDVEWSVSRSAVITPVALVTPVELSGALVSRISLHNYGRVQALNVGVGAVANVVRRGGVIPYLESVQTPGPDGHAKPPAQCPSCSAPTRIEGDFVHCSQPDQCVTAIIGALKHFLNVIDCDGFGPKILEQLVSRGMVHEPADLYDLTHEQLMQLERMGDTLAKKLLANIAARRTLSLDVFLRALGIAELAKQTAAIVASFGDLDRVLALTVEELCGMHGIGEQVATAVTAGLAQKADVIANLRRHIDITAPVVQATSDGPLAGKTVLFTATLEAMQRRAAQELVESHGGRIASGVSKQLDYLVVGNAGKAGSKLTKAQALVESGAALSILNEEDFFALLST